MQNRMKASVMAKSKAQPNPKPSPIIAGEHAGDHKSEPTSSQMNVYIAVLGALVAVVVGLLTWNLYFSSQQGEHTAEIRGAKEQIKALREDVKSVELRLSKTIETNTKSINATISELATQVAANEKLFQIDQLDMSRLLVTLGIVGPGDVFYAAVHNGDIWVFPSDLLEPRLVEAGYKKKPARNGVSGYPVAPVRAIVGVDKPNQ